MFKDIFDIERIKNRVESSNRTYEMKKKYIFDACERDDDVRKLVGFLICYDSHSDRVTKEAKMADKMKMMLFNAGYDIFNHPIENVYNFISMYVSLYPEHPEYNNDMYDYACPVCKCALKFDGNDFSFEKIHDENDEREFVSTAMEYINFVDACISETE